MADSKNAGLKDSYLVLYNCLCCVGWSIVLSRGIRTLVVGGDDSLSDRLSNVYASVSDVLIYSQTAALLEILHAAIGLVRSPVVVTAMQVGSRIAALVAIVFAPTAQVQYGAGIMILSWSLVEVPRYAFYMSAIITGDATKKTPFPLFWLRYSLFAVLYPTGIFGELTVFFNAASDSAFGEIFPFAKIIYAYLLPAVYLLGSPFMIMNMIGNRKKSFKKRFAKPPPPPRGLVWPLDDKGGRSSTNVNKAILAASVRGVNPELGDAISNASGWRFKYNKYLKKMVEEQCKSPEAALQVARDGLQKAYELFEYVKPDGSSVSFKEVMSQKWTDDKFHTGYIKGNATPKKNSALEVPYKGEILSGEKLKTQIDKWVSYGTIEDSAGEAMKGCVDNPGWLDLSDKYFVLLGAGSAMGPFLVLMALGANVIAVDLDRAPIWKRLISIARSSSGSITFPLKIPQSDCKDDETLYQNAGCNLFTQTPMIRDWLLDLYPGKGFTVGSYAYLNGALHVQVSLAMDAICRDLSEKRKNTSLAYLCTPTDLHLIPQEAHAASMELYNKFSNKLYCILLSLFSSGKFLRKNAARSPVKDSKNNDYYIVNGISVAQGPNYALAKRLQHWRAVVARHNGKGCIVSSNIAPSTSTVSVIQNKTFAWAYEGMPYFEPYEIFAPETSNAVMSAILLYDINDPTSKGNPKNELNNPNELFKYGGFHGGLWRCAYTVDSIGEASVLIYFGRLAMPYLGIAAALGAAVVAKLTGYV